MADRLLDSEEGRLPRNSTGIDSPLSSSINTPIPRSQANARLSEAISPSASPYGSVKSKDLDLTGAPGLVGNSFYGEGKEDEALRSSVVDVVKKHLVTREDITPTPSYSKGYYLANEPEPLQESTTPSENAEPSHDYSLSHNLQGGDVTRSIYKWQEDEERKLSLKRRSKSFSTLNQEPFGTKPSDILVPGGFRRHHVLNQAERQGRTSNLVAANFIDFLALYGHFAGDLYLEDGEEEEEGEEGGTPNETTPLVRRGSHRDTGPTASSGKAVFLLIKSFVGTGVLFLPRSFYDGGMAFSFLVLLVISFFGLHCMLLLVESQAAIGGSFGDMGQTLYGAWARYLVLFSIVVSQFGFACAYMIFISKNLQDVFYGVTECSYIIPEYWFILVQLVVYIPVALLRKIKSLSTMALVADVFIILGLMYLVTYNFMHISTHGFGKVAQFNKEGFTLFIGTAIFTFEGIGLVIPIVESMKEPEKFPAILSWTMAGITGVFIFIGSLSYATFGDNVKTVVLSNLPRGTLGSEVIQTMYALAIVLSVPLAVFPIIGILEGGLFSKSGRNIPLVKWQKNLFRLLTVLSLAAGSWLGSNSLNHFVSLVGSFCCIPLSFIYPAAFHLKAFPDASKFQRIKNQLIVVVGFILMVYVTQQTIANWNSGNDDQSSPCL